MRQLSDIALQCEAMSMSYVDQPATNRQYSPPSLWGGAFQRCSRGLHTYVASSCTAQLVCIACDSLRSLVEMFVRADVLF